MGEKYQPFEDGTYDETPDDGISCPYYAWFIVLLYESDHYTAILPELVGILIFPYIYIHNITIYI
jgi:hypothetical protein